MLLCFSYYDLVHNLNKTKSNHLLTLLKHTQFKKIKYSMFDSI